MAVMVAAALGAGCNSVAPPGTGTANRPTSCDGRDRSACVAEVAVGNAFGCAALGDGTVWCWGRNDQSQLGYVSTDVCVEDLGGGTTQSIACHTFPYEVEGTGHAIHVATGGAQACALLDDGTVRCWGANQSGQLGNGATLPSMRPVAVSNVAHATQIALGARHGCAVVDSGAVKCWGANDRSQLGGGASPASMCDAPEGRVACQTTPVAVPGLTDILAIGAGALHTCAMGRHGTVSCWGDNSYGQLGNGAASLVPQALPSPVLLGGHPLADAVALAVGDSHACALRGDGTVVCWGRADGGAVGPVPSGDQPVGCAGACQTSAVAVPGLVGVVPPPDGAASDASTMDGEGGTTDSDAGTPDDASVPPQDAGTSSGDAGARSDGGARVDGGARDAGTTPVVDASSGPRLAVAGIVAGASFSCARLSDQTLRCWGADDTGQLGDGSGTPMPRDVTMVIAGPGAAPSNPLENVLDFAAGGSSACARLADYTLRCWGSNRDGALGVGGTDTRSGPVPVAW